MTGHIIKEEHSHKKPSLAIILLVASGLVFAGICLYLMVSPKSIARRAAPDTGQVTKHDTFVKNYDINYPIFHRAAVDMTLRNYGTHQADEFLQKLKNTAPDPNTYLTLKYTILHYGALSATVIFHKSEQLPGQPVVRSQERMTFDLQTQKLLTVTDLFKDATVAGPLLGRILHDYFQHDKPGVLSAPEIEQLTHFQLAATQEYVLDDDGLILYVNLHAPMAETEKVAIRIKKELLADILNTPFVAFDSSLIQGNIEPPTYAIETIPYHDVTIDPNGKLLALTFDDGPGNLTAKLLDTLKRYSARATFFVIGRQVPSYASVVQRTVSEGHEVGNHSWNHANFTLLSHGQLQQQIGDTQQAVQRATGGYSPVLMRPPEGAYNGAVAAYLQSQHLRMELWSVDTLDWLNRDAQVVYNRIMAGAGDGRVILLHDIHSTSVDAATRAIPDLIAQGYQLVTVSQLHQYR